MDMFRKGIVAAALAGGLAVAPAGAVVMEAVFTGTVSSGYDQTGMFGTPGGSLDGMSFILVYTFDTTLGYRQKDIYADILLGGSSTPFSNPTVSAVLSMGSGSVSSSGSYQSQYSIYDTAIVFDEYFAYAHERATSMDGSFSYREIYSSLYSDSEFLPVDLEEPFNLEIASGEYSYFTFLSYDAETNTNPINTNGFLDFAHLSVREVVPAPVPLPASGLSLLAAGLALAALRRRGQRAV